MPSRSFVYFLHVLCGGRLLQQWYCQPGTGTDPGRWPVGVGIAPPASAGASVLNSVSCSLPGVCVAAGYFYNGSEDQVLVETLAKGAWTVSQSPDANTFGANILRADSSLPSASCAAAGETFFTAGEDQVSDRGDQQRGMALSAQPAHHNAHGDVAFFYPGPRFYWPDGRLCRHRRARSRLEGRLVSPTMGPWSPGVACVRGQRCSHMFGH